VWKLDPKLKHLEIIEKQRINGKLRYMKVLDKERIIGFTVDSNPRAAPSIRPIYEVTIYLKPAGGRDKDTMYVFTAHRVGDRLAGFSYIEDPDGSQMATIAAHAINYLVARTPKARRARAKHEAHFVEVLKGIASPKDKAKQNKEGRLYVQERLRKDSFERNVSPPPKKKKAKKP
jgi:hypothetical protein